MASAAVTWSEVIRENAIFLFLSVIIIVLTVTEVNSQEAKKKVAANVESDSFKKDV